MDSYRAFLNRVLVEQLKLGIGDWQLIGNGLAVPYPTFTDSLAWETKCRVYDEMDFSFRSGEGNCATGGAIDKEACREGHTRRC